MVGYLEIHAIARQMPVTSTGAAFQAKIAGEALEMAFSAMSHLTRPHPTHYAMNCISRSLTTGIEIMAPPGLDFGLARASIRAGRQSASP